MIKFLLLLFSLGIVASQRSQFVDYVLDLQHAVGYIHDEIQDGAWKARFDISNHLTEIVGDTVVEITNGLSSFLTMRDRYTNYIEETRTAENTECVDAAMGNWTTLQRDIGAVIGSCGGNTMDELHGNVYGFHQFINSNRQLKFDAQNIVLNAFTKLNPMTQAMDLTLTVEQDINEIYERYESELLPGINQRLEEFVRLQEEVPPQVHDCIANALNRMSNEVATIIDAARNC